MSRRFFDRRRSRAAAVGAREAIAARVERAIRQRVAALISHLRRPNPEQTELEKIARPNVALYWRRYCLPGACFTAISRDFVREFRVPSKKQRHQRKMPLGEKLRGRAENCHRLASGIHDPKFTLVLKNLAHEYETIAAEADRFAHDSKLNSVEATKLRYDIRLSAYRRKRRLAPRASN